MAAGDTATWCATAERVPGEVRAAVTRLVDGARGDLAEVFYTHMLASPEAAVFLDHDVVHERLHSTMQRWLTELFTPFTADGAEAVIAHQRHIGEIHARTQVPVHLVVQGMRILKRRITEILQESALDPAAIVDAAQFAGDMLDLSLECMSEAFARSTERSVRTDEAYRLATATQNVAAERERQRAALLEWCQGVLFSLETREVPGPLAALASSEFGLWLAHKGVVMLGGGPELDSLTSSIERIDSILLPRLGTVGITPEIRRQLLSELQRELDALRFLLTTLFDRQQEFDAGRDHLTRLLNRRFLPAVLGHEVALHRTRSQLLAVILIDVDHFKHINDAHGHDAGDVALQQVATIVSDQVRAGDFVFRYGGDELLIVLVETTPEATRRIAEAIRAKVEHAELTLGAGSTARTTVSMGIAVSDGHPDPQRLVTRADAALLEAKAAGRNGWRTSG